MSSPHGDEPRSSEEAPTPQKKSRGKPPRAMREPGHGRRFNAPHPPELPPPVAGAAAGLLVGLVSVGLVFLGSLGCEAIEGTSSCGGPGLLMLLVIIATAFLIGAWLLRYAGIPDPALVSFMSVMVVLTAVMALLIEVVFSPWMILILPVVNALAFCVGAWLTSRTAQ